MKLKRIFKRCKIAYETIITDFSDNDNSTNAKPLLNKDIYNQFDEALKERAKEVILQK